MVTISWQPFQSFDEAVKKTCSCQNGVEANRAYLKRLQVNLSSEEDPRARPQSLCPSFKVKT